MKKKKDYIPRKDNAMAAFLKSFNHSLEAQAEALHLSPEYIAAIQAENESLVAAIGEVNSAKTHLRSVVANKETLRKTVEKSIRKTAGNIKTSPYYTEIIGQALNILGHGHDWDPDTAQPTLEIYLDGGQPFIAFNKAQSNGIHVWSRRSGEAQFSFLAQCSRSPFRDKRPNRVADVPERREYYAFHILEDDEPVGQKSATASLSL